MTQTRDLVVQLLASLGSPKEAQHYLKRYASAAEPVIAVIKVGGQILHEDLDALADALAFLQQVHLRPVVVHGAGPQLSAALAHEAVPSSFVDGMRVTTPAVLQIARRVFREVNQRLVDALAQREVSARPIPSGVIEARPHVDTRLGHVGEVGAVHLDAITSSVRARAIPVVGPLGETATGQILNVNADVVTTAIAHALKVQKVVFLTGTGGLLGEQGQVLSAINLDTDYDALMQEPWLSGGMRLKLQEIDALLRGLPPGASVSITSPSQLARELFTHQGAGTLVRVGEKITRTEGFDDVDKGALRSLIEGCFGRALSATYFADKTPIAVYIAGAHRAVAIVTREQGMPYLDKFAVTKAAQGEGVGASLWATMRRDFPTLLWRSRRENPINPWYFKQADGAVRGEEWVVFWSGDVDLHAMPARVEHVRALPPSLVDAPAATATEGSGS